MASQRLHNMPHMQYSLLKKTTEIHWLLYDNTVPSLNSVKILTASAIGREF